VVTVNLKDTHVHRQHSAVTRVCYIFLSPGAVSLPDLFVLRSSTLFIIPKCSPELLGILSRMPHRPKLNEEVTGSRDCCDGGDGESPIEEIHPHFKFITKYRDCHQAISNNGLPVLNR